MVAMAPMTKKLRGDASTSPLSKCLHVCVWFSPYMQVTKGACADFNLKMHSKRLAYSTPAISYLDLRGRSRIEGRVGKRQEKGGQTEGTGKRGGQEKEGEDRMERRENGKEEGGEVGRQREGEVEGGEEKLFRPTIISKSRRLWPVIIILLMVVEISSAFRPDKFFGGSSDQGIFRVVNSRFRPRRSVPCFSRIFHVAKACPRG